MPYVRCPACNTAGYSPPSLDGRGTCPHCGEAISVPRRGSLDRGLAGSGVDALGGSRPQSPALRKALRRVDEATPTDESDPEAAEQ